MNPLMIKTFIILIVFTGWSAFMFKTGVNDCKAKTEKASEKRFDTALEKKQTELDAAIKLQGDWQAKVIKLQQRKPLKATYEKQNIKNNNTNCSSIHGFGVFIRKLQEGYATEITESN